MALDEQVLQDQRLGGRLGHDVLVIGHLRDHALDLGLLASGGLEV